MFRTALFIALMMSAASLPAQSVPIAKTEAVRLRALLAASEEGHLKRNPLDALFEGDMRYADQFGDNISDAYVAAERRANQDDLAMLATIDRSALGAEDRISYDVFAYGKSVDLAGSDPSILRGFTDRPIDHMGGYHVFVPDMASGKGLAPSIPLPIMTTI